MNAVVAEPVESPEHRVAHFVAVAVITPVGTYPDEDDYRRFEDTEIIANVLAKAAKKLKLTNTSDWVARACGREINPGHSFREDHLSGIVEIEWHKHEGGGGARSVSQSLL